LEFVDDCALAALPVNFPFGKNDTQEGIVLPEEDGITSARWV
jgi:hypothetical protein